MSTDKIVINLSAKHFQAFKSRLHTEFPAWGVNKFAPTVYVNRRHDLVIMFSITGYVISAQEIERSKQIAAELESSSPLPEKANNFKFSPIQTKQRRSKINIKMGVGAAWFNK